MKTLLLLVASVACAFGESWSVEGPKGEKEVAVEYATHLQLMERMRASIELRKGSEADLIAAQFGLPKGGRFNINLVGEGVQVNDPRNYQVQVLDAAGKEVVRTRGLKDVTLTKETANLGLGLISVDIPTEWKGSLTVKLFYSTTKKMRTFVVKSGTAQQEQPQGKDPFAKEVKPGKGTPVKKPKPKKEP